MKSAHKNQELRRKKDRAIEDLFYLMSELCNQNLRKSSSSFSDPIESRMQDYFTQKNQGLIYGYKK